MAEDQEEAVAAVVVRVYHEQRNLFFLGWKRERLKASRAGNDVKWECMRGGEGGVVL